MLDVTGLRVRLIECVGLKAVARTGWVRAGIPSPESVAAHYWGVAWLVLLLAPEHLDKERALSMAIVHDLPEVRTGDRVPSTPAERAQKHADERVAMCALTEGLPEGRALLSLFDAYEAQECPESRFVKACDLLDMALQAAAYSDQHSASSKSVNLTEFVNSALSQLNEPTLRELVSGCSHGETC